MGLMEKGLSFFVEMDNSTKKADSSTAQKSNPHPGNISAKIPLSIDNTMVDRLNKVVLNRKTAYTALLETGEKLKRSISDDSIRLRASFDLITGEGRSLESINQAIDVHIADIDGEHLRFKNTTDSQLQQKSKLPRDQAGVLIKQNENFEKEINEARVKITQWETSIQQNNVNIADLNNEADRLEADIKSVYDQFKNAVEQVKSNLQNQKSILLTTLGR